MANSFLVRVGATTFGPFDDAKLCRLAVAAKVPREALISADGGTTWVLAESMRELFPRSDAAPPAAPAPEILPPIAQRSGDALLDALPAVRAGATKAAIVTGRSTAALTVATLKLSGRAAAGLARGVSAAVSRRREAKLRIAEARLREPPRAVPLAGPAYQQPMIVYQPAPVQNVSQRVVVQASASAVATARSGSGLFGCFLVSLLLVGGCIALLSIAGSPSRTHGPPASGPAATLPPAEEPVADELTAAESREPPGAPPLPVEVNSNVRTWTSDNGHTTEAQFAGAKFQEDGTGTVKLKKTDGRFISVPFEKLSPADQKFVNDRRR